MRQGMRARGFTIVEVMVAAGIATFIFMVGYYAVSTTIGASKETTSRVRDTENARLFFDMLKKDFATSFPGPGEIVKTREVLAQTSVYSHMPPNNPSPLVVTETLTGVSATSDILQFYCRSDLPNVRDESTFIRYYVNRNDGTLSRSAVVFDPTIPGKIPPDLADPKAQTNLANSNFAMFENVRSLAITFRKWDPTNKRYIQEGQVSPSACDSILVTLTFTDLFAQKGLDNSVPDKSKANYQTNLNNTYRTYSTVLPIPSSFVQ